MNRLLAKEKATQEKKDKPLSQINKQREKEMKEKWIYNISSKILNQHHISVLQKGLAFTPTPNKPPTLDLIVAVETGARQLGLNSDAASSLRSSAAKILANTKIPPPNITREERQAIKDLKNDDSISVLPADKGRATVVMDKEEYHRKMETLVDNADTYEKLNADPTQHHRETIAATLLPMKAYLPAASYYRLSPSTTANPPLMFGQPKVHKQGMPLRPIVSCRNTIFSALTKECGRILGPLVGKTSHHIKDSCDLVDKLRNISIPTGYSMCSFDLKDMFTCLDQETTLRLAKTMLENDRSLSKRTPIRINDILALVKLDLDLAYFRWRGDH